MITGAAGLIGSVIAKNILDHQAKVILIDADKNKLFEKFKNYSKNSNIMLISLDLLEIKKIDQIFKKIIKKFGKLDAVIHAAYPKSSGWGTNFENLKKKNLFEDLNNQLGLAILLSQRVLVYFKKQGYGNLIHLSSIQGTNAPRFEHYSGTSMISPIEYGAIKSGIISITKYLSKYYKNSNIRVNCVSPGGIYNGQPKSFLKKYKKSCNDKGMLNAKDISGTIIFLLSETSRYINGQNIIVDDGWSL